MTRDFEGKALVPGVNVDPVSVGAGMKRAVELGYFDWKAQMVVEQALLRWKRGEEDSAQRLWLSEYPTDLTSWFAILAAAVATGTAELKKETVTTIMICVVCDRPLNEGDRVLPVLRFHESSRPEGGFVHTEPTGFMHLSHVTGALGGVVH